MSIDPGVYALAKAMATMDGVLDAFLSEASGGPDLTGHYAGYMAEAACIVHDLEAEGFRLVKMDA
jgi:hypothetical protein